ncbi:MAG: hypothetical protein OHK0029_35330 [Armatimonadaceae bacterium]
MSVPYLDHSVYPDVDDLPSELVSDDEKADYLHRICSAWDFDIYPEQETFALLRTWKDIFDRYPIPESPAYHTFRQIFGWESVPIVPNPAVRLTYEIFDRLEGREPDPCLRFV